MIVDRTFQLRWATNLVRDAKGAPLLPPLFVLSQGPGVRLVDLRTAEEAIGVVGYIPGSARLSKDALKKLPRELPIVLVSRTGKTAAKVAKRMEKRGSKRVAALQGGVAAWRKQGFGISRDPAGLLATVDPETSLGEVEGPVTADHIREHIGDPGMVRWVRMVSLLAQETCSCIDGRDERGVVGTPGGDAGELVLMLAAHEQVEGAALGEDSIQRALLRRLDHFGGFYMHTDGHAFEALTERLREDPRTGEVVASFTKPKHLLRFFASPPAATREALLEHLVDPAHIGCGHLRLMVQHPEEYGVRGELVPSVIRAFFRLLWQGAPELSITLLEGEHAEAAVLNVRQQDKVWELSYAPLVSPSFGGRQIFVNHPDVAESFRAAQVRYLGGGSEALEEAVSSLASRQLTASLGHLAKGLPIFDAVFMRDGSIEIAEAS